MEDAYEIGIRLVLENGVSAGIATLQNELAAYDRALTATTGRLRTTTEVNRGLSAPIGPSKIVPAVRGPVTGEVSEASDKETGRKGEPPVSVPATSSRVAALPQTAVVPAPAVLRATLPEQYLRALERPRRLPVAPEPSVPATIQTPQTAPRHRHEPAMAIPAGVQLVMGAPPSNYAHYAPASPVNQTPAAVVEQASDSRPAPMPAPSRREGQQSVFVAHELAHSFEWSVRPIGNGFASAGAQAPLPVRDLVSSFDRGVTSAGDGFTSVGVQVSPRPERTPVAATEPASPMAAAPPPGPTQGDVYLDGTRVGRWISDRLAREVDRPQVGVTGFDPRVGPAWPGSLHGT